MRLRGNGARERRGSPRRAPAGRRKRPPARGGERGRAAPSAPDATGKDLAAAVATLPGARPGSLPERPRAQLATLVAAPPPGPEWLHEIKFDGYRVLARLARGHVRLLSRNGLDWTARLPAIQAAVARLPARAALLDGEVAVLLPSGATSFQALQNALAGEHGGTVLYYVFDLLHLDGTDLSRCPLEARKEALRRLLAERPGRLRFSDHVVGSGPEVLRQACRLGLEGIVSKRRDAQYEATRSRSWLKVKCLREQEVVVGGFTEPAGTRAELGALLVGVHDAAGALRYAGKVGTGFTGPTLRMLRRRLEPLRRPRSPFADAVPAAGRARWVAPTLVAQVAFTEWTKDGRLRHPAFKGLREDKPAAQVVREEPVVPAPAARGAAPAGAAVIAGVKLTHPDRVLYPVQGTTKHELARFYESIADWVLPHVRGRPLTLVRCPEGAGKSCFYMKHSGVWAPPALRRVRIQERTKMGEYLVVDDLAGLISLVQMGVLEVHTWNSTTEHLERPDRLVFDLDPGPAVAWPRVLDAARLVRAALAALGLESFVKTTGGKGLHVVTPLSPAADWDAGYAFSRQVAERIAREDPRGYTTRMPKAARTDKILIDFLRNRRGNTSVAAYSTRAREGAPVSTPLAWDELAPDLRSDHFTIANLPARLAGLRADPWARYGTLAQRLPGARRRERPR
jgi:bifunctional non-homologous end joining protein LigD